MAVLIGGSDWDIINTEISDSGYTEITYEKPIIAFFHKARGDSVMRLKRRSSDTKYVRIIPGEKPDMELMLSNSDCNNISLGFLTTEGGSEVVETIVII